MWLGVLSLFLILTVTRLEAADSFRAERPYSGQMIRKWMTSVSGEEQTRRKKAFLEHMGALHAGTRGLKRSFSDACLEEMRLAFISLHRIDKTLRESKWSYRLIFSKRSGPHLAMKIDEVENQIDFFVPHRLREAMGHWKNGRVESMILDEISYRKVLGPGLWVSFPALDRARYFYLPFAEEFPQLAKDEPIELFTQHFPEGRVVFVGRFGDFVEPELTSFGRIIQNLQPDLTSEIQEEIKRANGFHETLRDVLPR